MCGVYMHTGTCVHSPCVCDKKCMCMLFVLACYVGVRERLSVCV